MSDFLWEWANVVVVCLIVAGLIALAAATYVFLAAGLLVPGVVFAVLAFAAYTATFAAFRIVP